MLYSAKLVKTFGKEPTIFIGRMYYEHGKQCIWEWDNLKNAKTIREAIQKIKAKYKVIRKISRQELEKMNIYNDPRPECITFEYQ